jgi:hypothetical protein
MGELLEGKKYRKRKAEDVAIKQEQDVVPQRKSGRFWLGEEMANRLVLTVEQQVDIVLRNTIYGRLLKEADEEEREALAAGEEYPTKKHWR